MTVDCPTCGDTLSSERAVNIHHAQAHGESLAFEEYECDYCGDRFEKQATKANGENTYCSSDCHYAHKRIDIEKSRLYELYWGENLSAYEIADELDYSQNTIRRRMSDYGIPLVAQAGNHDAWIFLQRPTEYLKQEYHDKRKSTYTIARENNVSQEWVRRVLQKRGIKLRNEWIKHKKDTDALKRIEYDYGAEWAEIRQRVIDRHNAVCQGCATPEGQLENALEVHHIKALRECDTTDVANQEDNLVPLCVNCHNRWENIPVRPEVV